GGGAGPDGRRPRVDRCGRRRLELDALGPAAEHERDPKGDGAVPGPVSRSASHLRRPRARRERRDPRQPGLSRRHRAVRAPGQRRSRALVLPSGRATALPALVAAGEEARAPCQTLTLTLSRRREREPLTRAARAGRATA